MMYDTITTKPFGISPEEELEQSLIDDCSYAIYKYLLHRRKDNFSKTISDFKRSAQGLAISLLHNDVYGIKAIIRDAAKEV